MHTAFVMLAGIAILAAAILLGHAFGNGVRGSALGALIFIPVWLIVAVANLWLGIRNAGYTLAEEMPIFVGIFGSLALLALGVRWWLGRS